MHIFFLVIGGANIWDVLAAVGGGKRNDHRQVASAINRDIKIQIVHQAQGVCCRDIDVAIAIDSRNADQIQLFRKPCQHNRDGII